MVLEARKPNIKLLADLMSGESPFLGLQTAAFLLCPHIGERYRERGEGTETETETERQRERCLLSHLIRTVILSWGLHPYYLI